MFKKTYHKLLIKSDNNYTKKINFLFKKLDLNYGLTLLDIGAEGEIIKRWKRVGSFINYVGLEPDKRSRDILVEKNNTCLSYKIIDKLISDNSNQKKMNLCRAPWNSSLLKPNSDFLNRYPNPSRFDIVSKELIESTTIDNLKIEDVDFLKIDIQGGELNALKGGKRTIDKLLGIEIETEFNSIYKDQPLFSDITKYMSSLNFEFIDLININRWQRDSLDFNLGQLIWADSLFLRSPEYVIDSYKNLDYLKKYIAICILYNRYDLSNFILNNSKPNKYLSSDFLARYKKMERRFKKVQVIKKRFNDLMELLMFNNEKIYTLH